MPSYVFSGQTGLPGGVSTAVPTSGSLSLDNFHGATPLVFRFVKTISTSTVDYNLRTDMLANGWDGTSTFMAIVGVAAGVYVSSSGAGGAFDTGVIAYNKSNKIIINVSGYIYGRGGNGGSALGSSGSPSNGNPGSYALYLRHTATVYVLSGGIIGGGGGGGGGGYATGGGGGAGGSSGGSGSGSGFGGGPGANGQPSGSLTVQNATPYGWNASYAGGGGGAVTGSAPSIYYTSTKINAGQASPGVGGGGGIVGGGGGWKNGSYDASSNGSYASSGPGAGVYASTAGGGGYYGTAGSAGWYYTSFSPVVGGTYSSGGAAGYSIRLLAPATVSTMIIGTVSGTIG